MPPILISSFSRLRPTAAVKRPILLSGGNNGGGRNITAMYFIFGRDLLFSFLFLPKIKAVKIIEKEM